MWLIKLANHKPSTITYVIFIHTQASQLLKSTDTKLYMLGYVMEDKNSVLGRCAHLSAKPHRQGCLRAWVCVHVCVSYIKWQERTCGASLLGNKPCQDLFCGHPAKRDICQSCRVPATASHCCTSHAMCCQPALTLGFCRSAEISKLFRWRTCDW